jgi:hypothetical protein
LLGQRTSRPRLSNCLSVRRAVSVLGREWRGRGPERRLERLHVAVTGRARDQVEHLDVAGRLRGVALGERPR